MIDFSHTEPRWYALTVQPHHEQFSSDILSGKGFEPFPALYTERRRWADRIKLVEKPLFPRYIFCRFAYDVRGDVLRTPGVISLVKFGLSVLPVDDVEIEGIRTVLASGLPIEQIDYVAVGDKVQVRRGVLTGAEGIVVRLKGRDRLVVSVDALQRSVAVELDRDWVSRAA